MGKIKTKVKAKAKRVKSAPPPQPAEISDMARFFIENHSNLTQEQLAARTGLSMQAVQDVLDSLPKPAPLTAGRQMGRDKGIVAMTEAASMKADDAREIARGPKMSREQYAKNNLNRIHTIDSSKPTR